MGEVVKVRLTGTGWNQWFAERGSNPLELGQGSVVDAERTPYGWDAAYVGTMYVGAIYSVKSGEEAYTGEEVTVTVLPEVTTPETSPDMVDHPSHYTQGPIEVIDVIEAFDLDKDGYRKDAVKYILRAPHKGKPQQDIKKAIWYLQRWLTRNPEEDNA